MQATAIQYAKKHVAGKVSEYIHSNPPSYHTDREVLEAIEQASQKDTSWFFKSKDPDIILHPHDRKILKRVKRNAWYLDKGCYFFGLNIGLDGMVGLIPGIGDFIGAVLGMYLISVAYEADLPTSLLAKMTLNVLFDFLIGLTPILGDFLDILFKCNWRNYIILEEYLITRRIDEIRIEKNQVYQVSDEPSSSNQQIANNDDAENLIEGSKSGDQVDSCSSSVNKDKKYGTF